MKITEMRQLLSDRGIQLTKSLGQNFLHDEKQIARIAAAGALTKADKVLEIGPGLGPLTDLLVAQAGEVLAIEMDLRLVEILQDRFRAAARRRAAENAVPSAGGTPNLRVLHADALEYIGQEARDWREWKLVSNMPYSVASPLMVELALNPRGPQMMVVTLQLEVAKRMMAKADDEDYGVLTLLVQLDYVRAGWFRISAGCFFPQPNVDSACVAFRRREQLLVTDTQRLVFVRLVKLAFSQRRKMMFKLLRAEWPEEKLSAAFTELGLSPQARAETVSLEKFVALTGLLSK